PALPTVDSPGRRQHVAETLRDGRGGFRASRFHAVRELVGVEARHAALPELTEHVALARCDAASQGNSQHGLVGLGGLVGRVSQVGWDYLTYPTHQAYLTVRRSSAARTVFFRSIATVSGPTPPGTGVSAPASSATAGCTSPTTTEPRRSKSWSRFDPSP